MALTVKDLEEIEKIVDEKIKERTSNLPTKDEFFTRMDQLMGELKTIRESATILTGRSSDHEDRISRVEKKISMAVSS